MGVSSHLYDLNIVSLIRFWSFRIFYLTYMPVFRYVRS